MTGVGKSGVTGDHNDWLNKTEFNRTINLNHEISNAPEKEPSSLVPIDKGIENSKKLLSQGVSQAMIQMFGPDPKGIIDDIRNASDTNSKNKLLIGFQDKIDSMPSSDLKISRDYIINIMESPVNKDDDLMFLLLKTVNKKLDAEHPKPFHPAPPIGPFIVPYDINKHGPKLMFD